MNAEQSLTLVISIVLCICLTINSVILVKDLSIGTTEVEPWQKGLMTRFITMFVMWAVWLFITFEFIPWFDSAQTQAQLAQKNPIAETYSDVGLVEPQ